jgi:outer membrane immunogenic protein
MNYKASVLGALASVIALGAASAADLPSRKEAPVAAPAVFTWTGWHGGISGGYAGGNADYNATLYSITALPGASWSVNPSIGTSGWLIGYTGGYSWQLSNDIVVGYENDFNYANVSNNGGVLASGGVNSRLNWFGTERLRFGYAMGRFLPYITGGFAYGRINGTSWTSGYEAMIPIGNSGDRWRGGWAVGGGLEYAVTDTISIKGEYLYASIGAPNGSAVGWGGNTFAVVNGGNYNLNIARGGINYHIKSFSKFFGIDALGAL